MCKFLTDIAMENKLLCLVIYKASDEFESITDISKSINRFKDNIRTSYEASKTSVDFSSSVFSNMERYFDHYMLNYKNLLKYICCVDFRNFLDMYSDELLYIMHVQSYLTSTIRYTNKTTMIIDHNIAVILFLDDLVHNYGNIEVINNVVPFTIKTYVNNIKNMYFEYERESFGKFLDSIEIEISLNNMVCAVNTINDNKALNNFKNEFYDIILYFKNKDANIEKEEADSSSEE